MDFGRIIRPKITYLLRGGILEIIAHTNLIEEKQACPFFNLILQLSSENFLLVFIPYEQCFVKIKFKIIIIVVNFSQKKCLRYTINKRA